MWSSMTAAAQADPPDEPPQDLERSKGFLGMPNPELVEKENNAIKAEMRAIIWSSNYQRINQRFEQITGERLKEDISILCLASIEFSPKHGLALHIQDIEPTYYEITDGAWTGNNRYGVVHRIASDGSEKGIGQFCINWAFEQCGHLRMDTHTDNVIMQKLLTKLGFHIRG